ncbi:MAG TPA: M20 family metallopeptidase [Acidimicrobiales bacterium]|nr:M20 family metallopeptidase [Acidimicrobiales bacterium]
MTALPVSADEMVDLLAALVAAESPSTEPDAVAACARLVADAGAALLGEKAEQVVVDGRTHLRWRFGAGPTRVVLVGHVDTVWPRGTIERWPFSVTDGIATGPGAFDMKAGIVQLLHALAAVDDRDGVAVLLTADEEVGSPTSRALIEETSRGAAAALILEPSAGAAVKTARKGVSNYQVVARGRAAHAGLEPEKGVNAAVEIAHVVVGLAAIARPHEGTTVTPTVVHAGTATNVVPAEAAVDVDVRAATADEQARVDAAFRRLTPTLPDAELEVRGGPNRPPLPTSSSAELFARAQAVAARLGQPPLEGAEVGGGSDGNFTAAIGVPTLDGLGAVGGGAHAEGEHVVLAAMPARVALLTELVRDLLSTT